MNFRRLILKSKREILAGKDSKTNDELVLLADKEEVLLHTKMPGSPFVNCGINPIKEELEEAAIFCAKYSQDWKKNKGDVIVNVFLKKDMKKDRSMKEGTWEVKKSSKIKVKKEEILEFERRLENGKSN
jgi:predicted ribosome quality control (RQC) complex YloA/Tae2 family protein